MKGLKITLTHGRIWTAETSDGKRATGASLESALSDLWPVGERPPQAADWNPLASIFNGIRDSGGDGQFREGRAGA